MPTDPRPTSRIVTLVLVTPDGGAVGVLPPFEVDVPWWPEAAAVVRGARERFRLDVTVLRLLHAAEPGVMGGGAVTYLAEVAGPAADAAAWTGSLDDHPLRVPWPRPGGPDADLAWARARLAERGIATTGRAEQIRTWNLSSLWRLPTVDGMAWLKVVPPFFAHEGRLLQRLQGERVPALLAADGHRILMPEIPGSDLYDATGATLIRMVSQLVALEAPWVGRTDELFAIGLPDWRAPALTLLIADVVERFGSQLDGPARARLERFVDELADRFGAVEACGLPDTLVHGDFHPGNHRGTQEQIVLLDWGDGGVGHPLLDQPAFLERVPHTELDGVRAHWARCWRDAVPGSDPVRAAELLAPVAAARQAVIYVKFLDGIEPSEHVYHANDPADWLGRTAAML